ncbi:unnamed protein product, partial [Didymodactylos carnosus]
LKSWNPVYCEPNITQYYCTILLSDQYYWSQQIGMNGQNEVINVLIATKYQPIIDIIKSCVNQFSNNLQFNYVNPNDIPQLHQYFRSAHIIFGEPLTFIPFINQYFTTNLKWLQSTYAGVDTIVKKSKNNNYIVTRAPVYGQQMSEYCLGHIISHERHFPLLREAQLNKQWLTCSYRLLSSLRVGIMGASG